MIRSSFILALIVFTYSAFGQSDRARSRFEVSIVQNGREYLVENNVVELSRQPFALMFKFDTLLTLLVNTSFDSISYLQASKNERLTKILGFKESCMAEALYNYDKDISVYNKASNCFYVESDSAHSFDEIKKVGDKLIPSRWTVTTSQP
jgi:hypothetical protein